MEQDYTKDLTFILTGSGEIKMPLLSQALEQFAFGDLENREIRVIVPFDHTTTKGQETFLTWAKAIGVDLTIVKFSKFTHPITDIAKKVIDVSTMPKMMEQTFAEIAQAELMEDNQTAFVSLYNPASASDLAWVEEAKKYDWLMTLNLSDGLVDHFDGYESIGEKESRISAEKKAEELEQQEKEETKAAKKTAAKKATTPRKRAASKPKVDEPIEPVIVPEKPVQDSPVTSGWGDHTHYFIWVDDQNGKEGMFCRHCGISENDDTSEKPANYELSGTIVVNSSLPAELEPAKITRQNGDTWEEIRDGHVYGFQMLNGEIQTTGSLGLHNELTHVPQDVWKDVAQNVPATTSVLVSREDMVKLGDAMQQMANGFADALDVYKKMVGGE